MASKGAFKYSSGGETQKETSTFTFVWSRTLASLLGSAILQGDRWVVGAIAGPEFLAAYEVAWRVAVLPRFLVQNLAIAVSGDAGHIYRMDPRKIRALLFNSTMISLIVCAIASGFVSIFYFGVTGILGVASLPAVYFMLLGAFAVIAISAPLSFIAVAIGLPSLDIAYLIFTSVVSASAGLLAFSFHSELLFITGNALAITVGALWYMNYGSRAVNRRCRQAARAARLRRLQSA
jgi:O-antigen/teichoic acid export membrane protein